MAVMILATLCITYFLENFFRNAASALTPVLIQELDINRVTMGLLLTGFFLIYGIMQFPAGVLTDALGPRKTIISFTALTCIGSLLFWLSYRFELLIVAQFILGIGTSVFYINAVTLLSRWFPAERKATAIGVLSASSGIGSFTSFMGFPLATTLWGSWRTLYLVMFGVLVANWVMNFLILKDSPNPTLIVRSEQRNLVSSFKDTLLDRRFFPILFCFVMLDFNFILSAWIDQFLIEAKGLVYIQAGAVASMGTIAGFTGCIVMGFISDKLKRRKLPLVIFLSMNLFLYALITFIPAGYPIALYAVIWASFTFCGSIWVLFFSMVGEVLPYEKVGIGLGVMNGTSFILSSALAPIYGALVDMTGSYYVPNTISLGMIGLTLVVIIILVRESYGAVIRE
jgi:MFS family permease